MVATVPESSALLLHSELESIIKVLATKAPIVEKHQQEALALALLLLHGHSLFRNDASFLEAFHGLQRQPISRDRQLQRALSAGQRNLSLLFLVVLPYLNDKLRTWHKHDAKDLQHTLPSSLLQKIRRISLGSYPFIQTVIKGVNFACEALYNLKAIDFKSPILYIQKVQIASAPVMEMMTKSRYENGIQAKNPLEVMQKLMNKVLSYIQLALTLELHRSHWLKWWTGEIQKKIKDKQLREVQRYSIPPPPPPAYEVSTSNWKLCPACQEEKGNRTLCISCGYMVCEDCIETKLCPLTSKPMQKRAVQLSTHS